MNTRYRHSRLLGSWFALAGAAALAVAGTALAAQPGTWQSHKVTFDYLGISPVYSCDGLQDHLTYLLTKSGARLDGPVRPQSCNRGFGVPSTLASARLSFSVLQPAGDGGADAARVPGNWRQVTISPNTSGLVLRGADCELVQEFKDKVLPLLTVRNVQSNLHCIPHQTTGNQFALSFEVFVPSGTDHH